MSDLNAKLRASLARLPPVADPRSIGGSWASEYDEFLEVTYSLRGGRQSGRKSDTYNSFRTVRPCRAPNPPERP